MKKESEIIKFAEKYAYIFNPYKNKTEKITLFDYQKKILNNFEKNKFTIIKQSRQVGIDTVVAIYAAYLLIKNNEKTILAIYDSIDSAKNFLQTVRNIIMHVEESCENKKNRLFFINNKREIQLKNKSRLIVMGDTPNGGKSYRIDLLFMNNFEYISHSKDIWAAAGWTLSVNNGKSIFASTPKYKKGFFHELWNNAIKKKNDFKPVNINWKQNPYFDNVWYENMCKRFNYDKDSIATELDGKFISKKENRKKTTITMRIEIDKKDKILNRIKQKNMSSITDYIIELINNDLKCY